MSGEITEAERWAAFIETASFDGVFRDGSTSFASRRAMLRVIMCPAGPEAMLADAGFAVTQEPAWSAYRGDALWALSEAHLLAGHVDRARSLLAEASTAAAARGFVDIAVLCESQLAWLAMDRGDWSEADSRLEYALAAVDKNRMNDYIKCLQAFADAARLSVHHGDLSKAQRQLTRAMRARPSATYVVPIVAVRLRLHLAKVYLALADVATARQLLLEIDDILRHRPALGTLVGEVEEFRRVLASSNLTGAVGSPALTPAELRLLPYLQTHLTASGIAERMLLSTHTVKSQFQSIYRKLGVTTRHDAVQKATTIGLLGA